jgi:Protein of unknown function (DUF3179)
VSGLAALAALGALAALAAAAPLPAEEPAAAAASETAAGKAAAGLSSEEGYGLLRAMLSDKPADRRAAARRLIEAGDASLLPGLVDSLFFTRRADRAEIFPVLRALSGEKRGERYQDWADLVGRRADLAPKPGYTAWKAELFSRIDPGYKKILYATAPARIRLAEVVSGGVGVEGIPALDRPPHAAAGTPEAGYLQDSEKVFGVSLGGAERAYPLRILDWHEMLNDEVGGEPVTLSYCTLCGSAVLFSTRTPSGKPYTFGTSGLLYRSNKLMVDRQTLSLWSNLTGEPQIGRLAASPVRLEILPLTLTTWKEWRTRHPRTTVMTIDPAMVKRWGFDYRPGVADRRRAGVRFPVPRESDALEERDEIYAVRLAGQAKAYPLATLLEKRVLNDQLGDETLVLVADPASGAVRAYRRGGRTFAAVSSGSGGGGAGDLVDEAGRRWTVGEEALTPATPAAPAASATSPDTGAGTGDAAALARVPGHRAFWFGWYAFFPDAELYGGKQ